MKPSHNQQRRELGYSLLLIILIPASIMGSTLWLTSQVKQNFDLELRRKANLANEVFGVNVSNALAHNTESQAAIVLQDLIDNTTRQAPEIDQLSVSVQTPSGPKTIASSDPSRNNQPDSAIQTQAAFSEKQSIASLVATDENSSRKWLVATPVLDVNGLPLAVTTMRVSLSESDAVMTTTLRDAFILLIVILAVIILLLLHHFHFARYAELFRKLKELDQMKDDFISVATHELRTPMSIIKGYISIAQEEKQSKTGKQALAIALEQTDRFNHLITDLLNVSRLEQGKTAFELKSVDLATMIGPMVKTFKVRAHEKNLKLSYQPPAGLPAANADSDRLAEVFSNLIDNAIKYSPHGTVTISHSTTEACVITTFSDTGIGMTPDEQSRLFQRFYRARNADTAAISGTGLGLWIIKQYVEHMGGSIEVRSQKGSGSSFVVTLPKAPLAGPSPSAPPAPSK